MFVTDRTIVENKSNMNNKSHMKTFVNYYLPPEETTLRQRRKSKLSKGISDDVKGITYKNHKENISYNLNNPKKNFHTKDEPEHVETKRISRKIKSSPSSALRYHTNRRWKTHAVVKEGTITTPLKKFDSSSFFLESKEIKRTSLLKSKNYPNSKFPSNEFIKERKYERPSRKSDSWEITVGSHKAKLRYQTKRKWKTHAVVKGRITNAPLNKLVSRGSDIEANKLKEPPSLQTRNHLNSKVKMNNNLKERTDKRPMSRLESWSLVKEFHKAQRSSSLTLRNNDRTRKNSSDHEKRKSKQPLKKSGSWSLVADSRKPKRSYFTLRKCMNMQWNPNEIPKQKIIYVPLDGRVSWSIAAEPNKQKRSINHKNRPDVFTEKIKMHRPLEKTISWSLISQSHKLKTSPPLTSKTHHNRKWRSNATVTARGNNKLLKNSGSWSLIDETKKLQKSSTKPKYNERSHSEYALWTGQRLAVQSDSIVNRTHQNSLVYWVSTELKYLIALPIDNQKMNPTFKDRNGETHSKETSDIDIEGEKGLDSHYKKKSPNSLTLDTIELRDSNSSKKKNSQSPITSWESVSISDIIADRESFESRSKEKPRPKRRGLFCCLKPAYSPSISPTSSKKMRKRARTLSSVPSIYSWEEKPPLNSKGSKEKNQLIPESKSRKKLYSPVSSLSSDFSISNSFESRAKAEPGSKPRGLFCCLKPASSPPISPKTSKEKRKRTRTLSAISKPSVDSWGKNSRNLNETLDFSTEKNSNLEKSESISNKEELIDPQKSTSSERIIDYIQKRISPQVKRSYSMTSKVQPNKKTGSLDLREDDFSEERGVVHSYSTSKFMNKKPTNYWVKTELKYVIAIPVGKTKEHETTKTATNSENPPNDQDASGYQSLSVRKSSVKKTDRELSIGEHKDFEREKNSILSNSQSEPNRVSLVLPPGKKEVAPDPVTVKKSDSITSISDSDFSNSNFSFEPRSKAKPAPKPRGLFCCLKPAPSPPLSSSPPRGKKTPTFSSISEPSTGTWKNKQYSKESSLLRSLIPEKSSQEPLEQKEFVSKGKIPYSSLSSSSNEQIPSVRKKSTSRKSSDEKNVEIQARQRKSSGPTIKYLPEKTLKTSDSANSFTSDLDSFESSSKDTVLPKPRGLISCKKPARLSPPTPTDNQRRNRPQSPISQLSTNTWEMKPSRMGGTAVLTSKKPTQKNELDHHHSSISSSSTSSISSSSSETLPSKQKQIRPRELPPKNKNKWETRSTTKKTLVPQKKNIVLNQSSYDKKHAHRHRLIHSTKEFPHKKEWGPRTQKEKKSVRRDFSSSSSATSSSSLGSSSNLSSEQKPSRFKSSSVGRSKVKNQGKSREGKGKRLGNQNIHCSPPNSKRRVPVEKSWRPRTYKRKESREVSFTSSSGSSNISSSSSSLISSTSLSSGKNLHRPKTLTYGKRKGEPGSIKRKPSSPQRKKYTTKRKQVEPRIQESFISVYSNESIHNRHQSSIPRKYIRKSEPENKTKKDKEYSPRLKESFSSISSSEHYQTKHSTPRKPKSKKDREPRGLKRRKPDRRVKESFSSSSSSENTPSKPQYTPRKRRFVKRKEPITRKKEIPRRRPSSITKLSLLPYLTLGKVLPRLEKEPSLKGKELTPEEKEKFWRSLNPDNKTKKISDKTQHKGSPPVPHRKSIGKNSRSIIVPGRTESVSNTDSSLSLSSFTSERSSTTSDKSKKRNPLGRLFRFPRAKAK